MSPRGRNEKPKVQAVSWWWSRDWTEASGSPATSAPTWGRMMGSGAAPHLQRSENPLPSLAGRCLLWKGPSRQGNSLGNTPSGESVRSSSTVAPCGMAGEAGGLKSRAGEREPARRGGCAWGCRQACRCHQHCHPLPSSPGSGRRPSCLDWCSRPPSSLPACRGHRETPDPCHALAHPCSGANHRWTQP